MAKTRLFAIRRWASQGRNCSAFPSAYFPQPKRGAETLDAFGLLTLFAGVLVHEGCLEGWHPWNFWWRL